MPPLPRTIRYFLATHEQRWFTRLETTPQNAYTYQAWTVRIALAEREFVAAQPPHALFTLRIWHCQTEIAVLDLLACVSIRRRILRLTDAHIGSDHGNFAGKLGRGGLNALCHALKETAHVHTVFVQGGVRNTGRNPGRAPKPFKC